MSQIYDIIIVGGGISGVRAAQAAAKNGLTYKIVEANSYLGGRILTEQLDLTEFQRAAPQVPSKYKMEHGAGWIHGTEENPLVDIFKELYAKYETEPFEDQLSAMFPGNAWIMPEYASYEHFTMVDGPTCHQFTKEEYDMYIAITCIHLRNILRTFNGLKLSEFVQPYMEWVAMTLATNEKTKDNAEIIARGVGWYFHSVEAYSGTPKGLMSASDLFVQESTARPFLEDVEYDIPNEILTAESAKELITLVNQASQIDVPAMIKSYLQTPMAMADAALQGCYLGDHSTLKCGMGKLVELFKRDVENCSDAVFCVDLHTKVTNIDHTAGENAYNTRSNSHGIGSPNAPTNKVVLECSDDDDIEGQLDALNLNTLKATILGGLALPPAMASSPTNGCGDLDLTSASTTTIVLESPIDVATPVEKYNAIVSAQNIQTGEEKKYYARYAVICTASVHSIMKNINFPVNSQGDEAKSILADSSSSVYYKKVLFCFPEQWWAHKQFTRLFALTQDAINFKKQRCKHCHSKPTDPVQDEEYNSLDVSQGAYPCLFSMAHEELSLTTTSCSGSDDDSEEELSCESIGDDRKHNSSSSIKSKSDLNNVPLDLHNPPPTTANKRPFAGTPIKGFSNHTPQQCSTTKIKMPKLSRDSTLLYLERASTMNFTPISFCGVNMIWESHIYNKQTPVLSASIVGNFAEHCVNLDDNLVKMMVWKQLEKIYRSTVGVHRAQGDFTFPSAIPKPLWSRVTHWAENPHILQSYSLVSDCTFSSEERITLAADQHLYFAGEALHVEHGGSVHGAIFSADFAVEKVLEKYCDVIPEEGRDSLHSFGLMDASPYSMPSSGPRHTPLLGATMEEDF